MERHALQEATGLIGESEPLREVMVKVEQMAPVSSTVLVEGRGAAAARKLVRACIGVTRAPRRNKPFIAVNVGALPESLLESELFGHEKGAFTGAAERRLGRFELADGGTLFSRRDFRNSAEHAGEAAARGWRSESSLGSVAYSPFP